MTKAKQPKATARIVRRTIVVNQNWDADLGDWIDGEFECEEKQETVFKGTDEEVADQIEQQQEWQAETR